MTHSRLASLFLMWWTVLLSLTATTEAQIERTFRHPEMSGGGFESVAIVHSDEWVIASNSRKITVWDRKSGELLRECELESYEPVLDVVRESIIYQGSDDQLYRCGFADLKSERVSISGKWKPLAVSNDGRLLCENSEIRGQMQLFDMKTGKVLLKSVLKVSDRLNGASLSPDGKRIVVTIDDEADTIRRFDVEKQIWDATSRGFLANVSNALWSPDGLWLAVICDRGGERSVVSLIDAQTLKPVGKPIEKDARDAAFLFSSDSQRLLVINSKNEFPLLFDVGTQQLLTSYYGMTNYPSRRHSSATFSSKGAHLAVLGREGHQTIELWDWQASLRFRQPTRTIATHAPANRDGSQDAGAIHVRYRPDSQLVVLAIPNRNLYEGAGTPTGAVIASVRDSVSDGKFIKGSEQPLPRDAANLLWLECQTGKVLATASSKSLQATDEQTGGNEFHSLNFSSDGKILCCLCDDRVVLWESADKQVRPKLVLPTEGRGWDGGWRSAVISPDGTQLHLVSRSEEQGYRAFDVRKREMVGQVKGQFGRNLVFISDTQFVSGLTVFNRRDGSEEFRANQDYDERFMTAKGPGRSVIGGFWSKVFQLDVESGRLSTPFAAHTTDYLRVHHFAARSDGELVATACGDSLIRVWHTSTGRLLAVLKGHAAAVDAVDFAPNGRELVSASRDGTTRFWDISDLIGDAPQPATVSLQLPTSANFQPSKGVTITIRFDRAATSDEIAEALEAAAQQARSQK